MQMRLICNNDEFEKISRVCDFLGIGVRVYSDRYYQNNKRLYINLSDDLSNDLLDRINNYINEK